MATLTPQEYPSSVDWQTNKQTVRDRTAFLFDNSLMSDIKFVVTDSQHESDDRQVRVPAHKFVLAISSPVFEAMFYGELAEKGEEIELPDTESNYLLEFLRFLYCDEVRLTPDNAFGVLYLAQKYIVPSIADKCWSFIDVNTCACLISDRAVATLNHGILNSLLKRDSLHLNKELDLFDALKNWAEAKSKEKDLEPTGEATREILGEAVNFIRFPTISRQDFSREVVPSGILTDKEALDMHQYYSRVIPPVNSKFPEIYRAGITSDAQLYECCRDGMTRSMPTTSFGEVLVVGSSTSGFNFGCKAKKESAKRKEISNESLDLLVEPRNVHLKGVHVITTVNPNEQFTADVRLLDETGHELAAETGTFMADVKATLGGQDMYGIVVKFKDPVLIWKSYKYTLQVEVKAVHASFGLQGLRTADLSNFVKVDGLYFNFEGSSRHIYKLLFHKLN